MPDLRQQVETARKAGYSDAEIVAYIGKSDPRVSKAKGSGYADAEIVGFLSGGPQQRPAGGSDPVVPVDAKRLKAGLQDLAVDPRARTDAQASMRKQAQNVARQYRPNKTVQQGELERDRMRALMQGYTFGLTAEMEGGIAAAGTGFRNALGRGPGYSAGDAYRARVAEERAREGAYAKEHPVENVANQLVGGVANPTNVVGGEFIAGARGGGSAVARAGGVNALVGAGYGAGSGTDARSRAQNALLGGTVGAGTGAALGAAGRALAPARTGARPVSPQRLLSRQGIDLTPGQMVGGAAQRVEDVAVGVPGLGVRRARLRQTDQLNTQVASRALAPLGEELPRNVRPGRELVRYVQGRISSAYDDALNPVTVQIDPPFQQGLQTARQGLQGAALEDFDTIVADSITQRFTGPVGGRVLKEADEEIGAAIRAASTRNSPSDRALIRALNNVQDGLDDLLGRTDPRALAAKTAADEAFANYVRMESASAASGARSGRFSAAQLNSAVRQADPSRRKGRYGRGEALMQDLTDPAMEVLPQQVPDSGSPTRLLVMGGAGAGAGGAALALNPVMAPKLAGLLLATNVTYSRPVMGALNAVYRATDERSAATALGRLSEMAARNPEAQAAYNALLAQQRDQAAAQPVAP